VVAWFKTFAGVEGLQETICHGKHYRYASESPTTAWSVKGEHGKDCEEILDATAKTC